ncbi:hypothetical protein Tco_0046493, partial [Tanacetum coccineum]
ILRVKKLEYKVKASKSRKRARVIISDNEEDLEDSYKQGSIIDEIDQNPSISLVQDERTSWIQEDANIAGRNSADTEILLEQEEPSELVKDFSSVSTAGVSTTKAVLSTVIPEVSTTVENLVYIRRSVEKRKDKGKAIMKEDESVQKKTKKQLEQERLSHEAAIRLQKIGEVSGSVEEQSAGKEKEVSKEELKKLLVIVPIEEVYIEALQVKYLIIDWEVFTEESRSYWRIIRVGNHTEDYQVFEDMLKRFDRDNLEKL